MDCGKIIDESIANCLDMLITIFTSEQMLNIYTGFIVMAIIAFIIKLLSYICFRVTGNSKRKSKKKANFINDIVSLTDFFRNK